jgi:hypothetical protein
MTEEMIAGLEGQGVSGENRNEQEAEENPNPDADSFDHLGCEDSTISGMVATRSGAVARFNRR